jgi:hypothetical protein
MTSERRTHARRILYSLEYLDMGADNGGVVVNLSEGGLGFQTVNPVTPNAQLPVSFSIATGYRIDLKARVVWVNEDGKIGGAAFGKLSKDSQSLIREWVAKQEAEHASGHEDLALDASAQVETRAALDALQTKIAEAVPEGVGQQGESFATEPAQSGTEETAPRNGVVPPTHAAQPMEAMPERFSEFESPAAAASSSHPIAKPHDTSFPDTQSIASYPSSHEPSRRAPEPAHNNAAAANFQRPAAPASHLPEKKHEPAAGSSFSAIPSISVWNRKGASLPASPGLQKDGAPLFPPGRDENIFARPSEGFEPEVERKHSGALLVVAIVIAVAAVGAFYLRTHRQQVGNAIVHIGDSIAGSSAANSTAPATAAPVSSTASSHTTAPLKPTLSPVQSSPAKTQGPNAAQSTSIRVAAKQGAGGNATVAARPSGAASPNKTLAQTAAKPSSLQNAHGPSKSQNAATTLASPLLAAQSEYQRGEQYLNGTGVTQDYAQAAQWFWRSLEAGYTDAALPLANLYLEGNGVSRSCTQARILLDVAAQKNNTQAIQQLAQLPDNCQ